MSTTTYTVAMADLKESAHTSLWSNYGNQVQIPTGRFSHALDSGLAAQSPASQHPARPRTDHHAYPYSRYSQEEADAYDRQAHPSLTTHHSFPNLKRPFQHGEQAPYTEMVQDLRDDSSKLGVGHDHKLLSFKRVPDKHTIVDQHGRIQQLDLTAQLHGMFFLSEMPANASDGTILQPELTCYRRNLFQVSGSLITPRGQLSVVTDSGETVVVNSTEVTISAIESVDGHAVRLIVIPWKTPPPNSPESVQTPDQEPAALPLIPFQEEAGEGEGEYAVYPIGWRRLQFRIATANNGRRKELQQHFVLHLKVVATLANGSKIVLTEATTAAIVVRGRSPRNFQARKEIPLLGSSAGSRGQALVETGLGIVAGPLTIKPQDKARSLNMEVPRSAFTFSSAGPKMPASPMSMRSNSYPTTWSAPPPMPVPVSGATGSYPATTMATESYQKMPLSGAANFTAEPQELPLQQSSMPSMQLSLVAHDHAQPPIRTQYAYVHGTSAPPPPQLSLPTAADSNLSVPRYVDNNPRPAKSPRHANHQSVHSSGSITNTDASNEYRYGPPYGGVNNHNTSSEISPQQQAQAQFGGGPQDSQPHLSASSSAHAPPPRDYFPSAASWTTTAGEATAPTYSNGEPRPYAMPDQYKAGPGVKSAQAPVAGYATGRASFDGMSHYSWNTT